MTWHIAKKEFHQNILTSRFIIGTLICFVFLIAVKITLLEEQKTLLYSYNSNVTENEENLHNYFTYSMIVSDALKPPEPLALFSEGVSKKLGGVITVQRQEVPHQAVQYVEDNPFLSVFQSLDVVLIFKLVLSLLALLFAFDMFSGEKEQGTLAMTLASATSRAEVFIGKYLGGMLSLSAALFLSFLIGLIFLLMTPFLKITGEMLIRIVFIYLISVVFVAAFFSIGALISSLTHKSATSLAVSLFVWVALIIIVPNLGDYMAARLKTVDPPRMVETEIANLRDEFRRDIIKFMAKIRSRYLMINGSADAAAGRYRFATATLEMMEFYDKYLPYSEDLRYEYAEKIYNLRKNYIDRLLGQARFVDRFTIFSPVRLYENMTDILARTDAVSHLRYLEQVRYYRNQILDYFEKKDVYNNYRFTSLMERGEPIKFSDETVDDQEIRRRWQALNKRVNFSTRPPLNLDDFPRFQYLPVSLSESLIKLLPFLAGLVSLVQILVLITYFCFVRYDVR
jgi:ABC-type transport system involved in multi-copper enzyme maturation permease subunit